MTQELITQEDMDLHCEFIENESTVERDEELQDLGYIKWKGKWYKCKEEED